MPTIQLTDIAAAADKKFGDYEVVISTGEVLTFLNPMRMSKERRTEFLNVFNLEKRVETHPDDDTFDLYRAAFEIAAKTKGAYTKLVKAIGDDPAQWELLFRDFEQASEVEKA